jgi:long-chain acyl-CoA synthetase
MSSGIRATLPYSIRGLRIDPEERDLTFTRFFEIAVAHPRKVALYYLGSSWTYGKLHDAILRFATALHRLGVGPHERVMLYLPNTPQWVIASFAIQRIGAVVVPVSPLYTAHELHYMLEDSGAKAIICADTNYVYVHETLDDTPLEVVITTTLIDMLPWWKRLIGYALNRVPHGRVAREPHVHSMKALLRRHPPSPPAVVIDPWRDLSTILYTGGTTAHPKAVPQNHRTEVAYVKDVMEEVLEGHIRPGEDVLLIVLPLYHVMARGIFLAVGLNQGNATVLMPEPHADALLFEIERRKVRWLLGVPTLYRRLLENDRIDQYRLDSLRWCLCGGDVLPEEVFRRWRQLTQAPLYQVYGATEVGHVAYSRLDEEPSPKTVGRPLSSFRVKVIDPDTQEDVATGEVGELWVSADFTLKSYWNAEADNAVSFVESGDEIYYRVGDYVTLSEDGAICFVERTADIIKHKGLRISASEVEAVLQDHPTVVAACVIGVPDEVVGERVKAIVVLKEGVRGTSSAELRAFCRERLVPYKVPRYIEFRDMLPRSKVGKLLRREIRRAEGG